MALYEVKKIDFNKIKNVDEYLDACKTAPITLCRSLEEVFAYCGANLHKGRFGYSGFFNNVEYTAVRIR